MAGETVVTIVGNLTADPELNFTQSGLGVANFTVASTPRSFDKQSNEWRDGEALFMRCSVWRETAEYVAESLKKGMRVIVQGRLRQRSFETREGEKRTVIELDVDEVGPSLRYARAQVTKAERGASRGGQQGGYGQQSQGGGYGQQQPAQQGGYGQQQGQPQQGGGGYGQPQQQPASVPQSDPWSTGPAASPAPAGSGWGGNFDEEPPF